MLKSARQIFRARAATFTSAGPKPTPPRLCDNCLGRVVAQQEKKVSFGWTFVEETIKMSATLFVLCGIAEYAFFDHPPNEKEKEKEKQKAISDGGVITN